MKSNTQLSDPYEIPPVSDAITLVSGLPRSGTSMMMRMLAAGGMPVVTDNIRQANEDNPNGYYELEKIKQLEADDTWLMAEKGKVIKAISALLPMLPKDIFYYVIFMQRNMEEILASQQKMLARRGTTTEAGVPDEVMAAKYEKYLAATYRWLEGQPHFHVIYVHYSDILSAPLDKAQEVSSFLGNGLDVEKMAAMVDSNLYRQRKSISSRI